MRKILVSFADSKYKKALDRIKKETEDFGFDERYFFTEKDLPKDFFKGFSPKVYRRGYSYWSWKPYIVKEMLNKLDDGDILVYSDAGTQWHVSGKQRFEEYIAMLNETMPILTFQQPFLIKDWTKGDVFNHICPNNWQEYAMQLQIWAGAFLVKKQNESVELFEKWYDIVKNHKDLITDKKSVVPNLKGFIEHRHDQAIFSLLIREIPHVEICWNEIESLKLNDWNDREKYPIWAKRDYKMSTYDKIKRKLNLFVSYPIGLYLVYFKRFYFFSKKWW